jgi:uncharacterized protein
MTPDLNVLLAASRTDHPHHDVAYCWLTEALEACEAGGSLEVLPMIAVGFLRLATNRRVFVNPTAPAAAVEFLDSLLSVPGVEMPDLGREWPITRQLCLEHALQANDLSDAWIAAAVISIGSHLVTFDRGFSRWLGASQATVLSPR